MKKNAWVGMCKDFNANDDITNTDGGNVGSTWKIDLNLTKLIPKYSLKVRAIWTKYSFPANKIHNLVTTVIDIYLFNKSHILRKTLIYIYVW